MIESANTAPDNLAAGIFRLTLLSINVNIVAMFFSVYGNAASSDAACELRPQPLANLPGVHGIVEVVASRVVEEFELAGCLGLRLTRVTHYRFDADTSRPAKLKTRQALA